MFIHLHLSGFHAAVHQAVEPRLAGRPVAVAIDAGSHAPLIAVSAEGRRYAVHPGMRAAAARRRCAGLVVVTPRPDLYRRARRAVVREAAAATPLVGGGGDGFDLDLAGTERAWRSVTGSDDPLVQAGWWAAALRRRMDQRLRLPACAGVAPRLRFARLAALAARDDADGVRVLPQADAAAVVAGWPLRWLHGLPWEILRLLADCGITTIGTAAGMPRADLRQLLGEGGDELLALLDDDPEPLVPPCSGPEPEILVSRSAGTGGADAARAMAMTATLARDLGFRLRADGLACTRLTLGGTHLDGRVSSRGALLPGQLRHDDELIRNAIGLLGALTRRVSWEQLSLSATGLCSAEDQQELFAPARPRRLEAARDLLRLRFGTEMVAPATHPE
jgi:DNA polymerase-4